MSYELIDTHCHLTALTHDSLPTILERAVAADVSRFVCIGAGDVTASASAAVKLAEANSNIWASIGVHPHDAGKCTDLSSLEALAEHPRVVAIGETGLDFFRDWAPKESQQRLFENSISFAKNFHKPLIIHCREAAEATLATLVKHGAHEVGGVFHCFAQDAGFAAKLRAMNFLVSFPGSITFKNARELRETVKAIPLEQIMLETDAPFLAPEPFRGQPNEPAHVLLIARKLAEVKEQPVEEIARVTTATARRFFRM